MKANRIIYAFKDDLTFEVIIVHLHQLLVVYFGFSSFGGNIYDNTNMAAVLFKANFISVNI